MKLLKPLVLGVFLSLISLTGAIAAETLKIGHIAARTGFLKGPGLPATVAVDMAVEEINAAGGVNGKMIEIIEFDSGSDPKQASLAARTLVKDHDVLAIIGPFSSGEAKVGFNVAEREKGCDDIDSIICTRVSPMAKTGHGALRRTKASNLQSCSKHSPKWMCRVLRSTLSMYRTKRSQQSLVQNFIQLCSRPSTLNMVSQWQLHMRALT